MIVIFSSQSQKKSLAKTSRVLDAFADRIGDSTWKTVITQEGLHAVKKLLKKTATKHTAVACHRIHGTSSTELLWIVGSRKYFNAEGIIPVNTTKQDVLQNSWENDWIFHTLMQAMVALAALFHDVGKANMAFQKKLTSRTKQPADPLRHEWVSCIFIVALVRSSNNNDKQWLEYLQRGQYDIPTLISSVQAIGSEESPFAGLPDYCFFIIWLVLGHHKLPVDKERKDLRDVSLPNLDAFKKLLSSQWGYAGAVPPKQSLEFPHGVVMQSPAWIAQTSKWAKKAQASLPLFEQSLQTHAIRPTLLYARLCLMFGDHLFSSSENDPRWEDPLNLYANTHNVQAGGERRLKQHLIEHLIGVQKEALTMAHVLPRFEKDLASAENVRSLKQKSPPRSRFAWQDTAVQAIHMWQQSAIAEKANASYGFFAVNMASTGCGKTFANAKIMQALSKDGQSLRFVLALGLRTLTLQTGDEYRTRIGLDETELAVLIGSKAVEALHSQTSEQVDLGSESSDSLLCGEVEYESGIPESQLTILLRDEASRKLLFSPVLSCTIDYMMMATETIRGGRGMLPFLRLMSSDLVIDEIDDFTGTDLVAIGRLIHLAGMLGSKVMISSATIPPDMAEGFFRAYRDGWAQYARARNLPLQIGCAWIDEFSSTVKSVNETTLNEACSMYKQYHSATILKKVHKMEKHEAKEGVRRKGSIVSCEHIFEAEAGLSREEAFFESIKNEAIALHRIHTYPDPETGIQVSFGCVRVANIAPCIALFQYLLSTQLPDDIEIRVMPYHSRQVLLLRSEQEKHLDMVLQCKNQDRSQALANPLIRNHLQHCKTKNLIFILVCTPVEEVGRDHDFDWAIIEPSSFRSIIQLAGRVRRHRTTPIEIPNISIMQYNLNGLSSREGPAFFRPGFETNEIMLDTHNLAELVDISLLTKSINSYPRISKNTPLYPTKSLIDLEHHTMERLLTAYNRTGPEALEGWLGSPLWSLSALPQRLSPFRSSSLPMQSIFLFFNGEDPPVFGIFEKSFIDKERILDIQVEANLPTSPFRLWMNRSYEELLLKQKELTGESFLRASLKYGEIQIREDTTGFLYSDQFGMKNKSM